MIFPQRTTGIWEVSPNDEAQADLIMTRSISLDKPSRIGIAKKPIVLYTNADDANLALLLAITSDENGYYFVTNDGIFTLTSFGLPPALSKVTTTGAPSTSLGRDGVMFNGNLHVGGSTTVGKLASGAWTSPITGLNASYPIRLENFQNKVNLAVANKNTVGLYDTSYALQTTLTIPVEYIITGMTWRQNNLYIYTRNVSGGTAMMFVWNGSGTAAQFGYGVQADWIYSGCEFDNAVAIVTSAGQILKFPGGGFTELANFPVYGTPYSWSSSSSLINGTGKVGFRGMQAIGKRLLMNIDGSVTVQGGGFPGVHLPQQPSGLWEYTDVSGLQHKAGYCHTKYKNVAVTDIGSKNIVVSAVHNLQTGDAVYFPNIEGLSGLLDGQTYFAIVTSTTTFKIALSVADAVAGYALAVTGTPTANTKVCYEVSNETGATFITAPGAIGIFNKNIQNPFFGSQIFFGGETPDDSGTNVYTLMSLGMGRNHTAIVTRRIGSGNPTDKFGQLTSFIDNLTADFESIVVKSRWKKDIGYPTQVSSSGVMKVTWTSSTVFTAGTTNRDLASVKIGDEVTIIQGAGAGYSAHVSSILLSGSTWTVTLDEAIGLIVAGNTSEIQVDNWTKEKIINNAASFLKQGYANMNLGRNGSWLQLKLELRGRDSTLNTFSAVNKPDKKQT